MNPGLVVKLRPVGPWRIGPDSGARNRVDTIFHSDTLYSAVTSAMARLGSLNDWLDATARNGTPAVSFGSCFPFLDEIGFVVPPRTIWPPTSPALMGAHVRWKSARFVPLGIVQALLAGQTLDESHWNVDGPSECLVPAGRPGPFRTGVRWNAAVDRLSGATERHSTACIEFRAGSGLWTVVAFGDESARDRWLEPVKAAFRLLADTGFGGERSRGWGRSEAPEFVEGILPGMILGEVSRPAVPVETAPEPEPVAEAAVLAPPAVAPFGVAAVEAPPVEPPAVDASEAEALPLAETAAEAVMAAPEEQPVPAAVSEPVSDPEATAVVESAAATSEPPSAPEAASESAATVSVASEVSAEAEPAMVAPAPEPAPEDTVEVPVAPEVVPEAEPVSLAASEPVPVPEPEPASVVEMAASAAPVSPVSPEGRPHAHWLLSLFTPAASDAVDWTRGNYTLMARGGRVESPAGSGELKKTVQMVSEGSVVYAAGAPRGSAADVAPDGFAHPVFRAGFAVAIPLPEVS